MDTDMADGEARKVPVIAEPASAVEALDGLLHRAAVIRASDVHIDPRASDILIRYRIDGMVEPGGTLPLRLCDEIVARLKILSGCRTDIHAIPQDGRFKADLDGEPYNIRVSFMPTYHGENAVIRLLPSRSEDMGSLVSLGFSAEHSVTIGRALDAPNGLILVTGPTGSGKTTTLRVCLGMKASGPISVMTLEDPVEYEVPGVRHVHIKHSYGVTFASGLRSALRQDPDVIMVGEIRDEETARTAVHTALTGHLVMSTMHTSSALEAVLRLSDMEVKRYLIAATLRLIIGQRLVRRICEVCGGDDAWGCEACGGEGYRGRSVIAEVCEVDAGMRELIASAKPASVIAGYAASRGFAPLAADAWAKVEWGMTTAEEAMRAIHS